VANNCSLFGKPYKLHTVNYIQVGIWVINNCDKTDINADRILVEIDIFLYWSNWVTNRNTASRNATV